MKNLKLHISPDVQEKILYKHGIGIDELWEAIKHGKPKIIRQEDKIYISITHYVRYITMIFKYDEPIANVITAYPSSEPQINRYNKK
ncbi:MAG TPA: hypothetical protein VI564_08610 [Candidatus Nanoarchaeia archaeon]|nr:hypothetical protein [Candidatus Nanoarchaeia archaeon]